MLRFDKLYKNIYILSNNISNGKKEQGFEVRKK